ncbi:MAG: hypothetical protein H0X17_19665 [Deltaproteobacteria bacterium]|nr:hypothetical protein [Deltaproteobacteria bacterium]
MSVVAACYAPEPRAGAPCANDLQCPSAQACIGGYCGARTDADVDELADAEPPDDGANPPPDAPPPGFCVLAADCANPNPCRDVACVSNQCVTTPRADGASCGAGAAARCCGGSCVDLTSDEANCGGCGQACATGRTCESVALTNACPSSPAETSGRCTCAGATAECPDDQICRTATPYANRCTPSSNASCAPGQTFVEVQLCPNYCRYP